MREKIRLKKGSERVSGRIAALSCWIGLLPSLTVPSPALQSSEVSPIDVWFIWCLHNVMAVETQRSFVIISAVSEPRGSRCSFHSIYLWCIKSFFILVLLLTADTPSPVPFTPPLSRYCVSVEHSSLESKKESCSGLSKPVWDTFGFEMNSINAIIVHCLVFHWLVWGMGERGNSLLCLCLCFSFGKDLLEFWSCRRSLRTMLL